MSDRTVTDFRKPDLSTSHIRIVDFLRFEIARNNRLIKLEESEMEEYKQEKQANSREKRKQTNKQNPKTKRGQKGLSGSGQKSSGEKCV